MKSKTTLLTPDDGRNNEFELREIIIRVTKNRNKNNQLDFLYIKGILYPSINNNQKAFTE